MQEEQQKQEVPFIQETVKQKKGKKVRRAVMKLLVVCLCACIFGLIARCVFILSEGWLSELLGVKEQERQPILIDATGTPTPIINRSTPKPTETSTPTEKPIAKPTEPNTPTAVPTQPAPSTDGTLSPEPTVTPEPTVIIVENSIAATISDYQSIYSDIRNLYQTIKPSLAYIEAVTYETDWLGNRVENRINTSGIILGNDGIDLLILTYYEALQAAEQMQAKLYNGSVFPAHILNFDAEYDLCILAIPLEQMTEAQLGAIKTVLFGDSNALTVGSPCFAIGNPNGISESVGLGMVTDKGSCAYITDNRVELFHTDLIAVEGQGGFVTNMNGEVVGMITTKLYAGGDEQLCTVMGITRLRRTIERLANQTPQVYFGILATDMPTSVLTEMGLEYGIYVAELATDSPAYEAGIRIGDIITNLNTAQINSVAGFYTILTEHAVGETLDVTVGRLSKSLAKKMQFQVQLEQK